MSKILLLEDDLHLRETIQDELEEAGFELSTTDNSDEVLEWTFDSRFDLYLFDVNVIGMDGFELLASLREAGDETPTIFLTSKNKTKDVIIGFESGASDYLKKPFDMEELIARIKRFLSVRPMYRIAENINYFPQTYQVNKDGCIVQLHQRDAQILEYFLKHKGEIVSKEQILHDVYNGEYITDSTFRGYINKIKTTIGKQYLRNIRGEGYIFETL